MRWAWAVLPLLVFAACDKIPGTVQYRAAQQARADAQEISDAEQLASRDLFDPNSAEFRDAYISENKKKSDAWHSGRVICGELNAKNKMGAYVGFTKFMSSAKDKKYMIAPQINVSLDDMHDANAACAAEAEASYQPDCERAKKLSSQSVDGLIFSIDWSERCIRPGQRKSPAV